MTPLRQHYPIKMLHVKFPMLSEIQPSNPLTRRSVPLRLLSPPMTCFPSLLPKSDDNQSINLLPRVFRYALCERHSDFYHRRVAHKSWRDVRFPMLFGMGLVNKFPLRSLHPNTTTAWIRSEFQCLPHEVTLHSIVSFFSQSLLRKYDDK